MKLLPATVPNYYFKTQCEASGPSANPIFKEPNLKRSSELENCNLPAPVSKPLHHVIPGDDLPFQPKSTKIDDYNFLARYKHGNRNKGIKICHWNIGGGFLKNKLNTIEALIADYEPHILGISEASFSTDHNLEDVQIQNYKVFFANTLHNPNLKISRIAVFVQEDLCVKVREDLMNDRFSSIWLEVGLPRQKKFLVSNIYRDWQYVHQENHDSLSIPQQLLRWEGFLQQWERAVSMGLEIHIQGDLNLNFLDFSNLSILPTSSQSVKLKSLIIALQDKIVPHGFTQLVQTATRIWPGVEPSLLDHHWTNHPHKVSDVHAFFQGASDHKMIFSIRRTKKIICKPKLIKKRSFKNFDPTTFTEAVKKISWLEVYLCEDLDTAVTLLENKINHILDEMAPVKVIQVRSSYAPWMSAETKARVKERNLAQEKASETQNEEDWKNYKKLRNVINNSLKVEKKNWQENKLNSFGNDTSSVWKNVKNWLGWSSGGAPTKLVVNGRIFTKPSDLCRIMNEFFVNKVANLRSNLPPNNGDPLFWIRNLMQGRKCSFRLKSVHPDDVLRIISNLKSSSSCGLDTIDSKIIKLVKHQLVPVVTHIVNLSIKQKKFPSPWKLSKVAPLHKKEEVIYAKNYRPVSLLAVFSKILERVIFEQMIQYLEVNHLLHRSHHGFRSSHSTVTALIEMYDQWMDALENDEVSAVIMLDLSAAFDVVDHEILIQKLEIYGVEAATIPWFRSYLSERSQQVYIEGSLSEPLSLEAGVPQGSILGPLLYVLFANDLPEVVHEHLPEPLPDHLPREVDHQLVVQPHNHPIGQVQEHSLNHFYNLNCSKCGGLCVYADDSTYTLSSKDTVQLKQDIKEKYKKIADYMGRNKHILNSDKTHLLIMTSAIKHRNHQNFNITLDTGSEIIEPISEERLLGGLVSSDLKWNKHVRDDKKSLITILTSRINALSKVASYSSFKTRKMIANGIVMSYVVYLVQLYGGCSEFLLSALQVLQNRAARIVTRLEWRTPAKTLLLQCGWLSIRQLVAFHSILLIFKTKQNKKPSYIYSKISQNFKIRTRLASSSGIRDTRMFEKSIAQ